MNKTIIIVMLLSAFDVFSQPAGGYYNTGDFGCTGFTEPYYWGRLTDSRAEAMGMTVAATSENINTSYYNPAGLGTLESIQASGTFANLNSTFEDSKFLYTAIGGKINDYIKVQFSRFSYRNNFGGHGWDNTGNGFEIEPLVTTYTLGVASGPIKNWFFGLNAKITEIGFPTDQRASTFIADFGMIKRFELAKKEGHHTVDLGLSVMNFTANDLNYKALGTTESDQIDAPVKGLFGVSYSYSTINKKVANKLDIFGLKFQGNYMNQLDLKSRSGFGVGLELAFLEMVYLRGGYYYRTTCDFGLPEYNRDNIQSLTYGIGVEVPLHKLTKIPLQFNIDFALLPEPSYIHDVEPLDDFYSINFRVNWQL